MREICLKCNYGYKLRNGKCSYCGKIFKPKPEEIKETKVVGTKLIDCPACGSEYSEVAEACPHCGWFDKEKRTKEAMKDTNFTCGCFVVVVLIFFTASLITYLTAPNAVIEFIKFLN